MRDFLQLTAYGAIGLLVCTLTMLSPVASAAQSCHDDEQIFAAVVRDIADSSKGPLEIDPAGEVHAILAGESGVLVCKEPLASVHEARRRALKALSIKETADASIRGCPGMTTAFEPEYIRARCTVKLLFLAVVGPLRQLESVATAQSNESHLFVRVNLVRLTFNGSSTQLVDYFVRSTGTRWVVDRIKAVEVS